MPSPFPTEAEQNPALSILAEEFEFTDPEVVRLNAAIQTWDSYSVNLDRRWLQLLVIASLAADPGARKSVMAEQPPIPVLGL
jgi:hypothetical protein